MLSLALKSARPPAPNPHFSIRNRLQSESGTVSLLRLRAHSCPWFQDLSNSIFGLPGYRFFPALSAEFPHGPALQQTYLLAASLLQALSSRNHSPGLLAQAPRGHSRTAAECSGRRVLLPLCGIAPARRLREDVRFEAVRLALAPNKVRETPHADANPQFERRPEIPAPRSRRTCAASKVVLSCQL